MPSTRVVALFALLFGAVAVTPLPQHSYSSFSRRSTVGVGEGQSCKQATCDTDFFCSTVDDRCKRKRGLHQSCRTTDGCSEPFACLNFQCQVLPVSSSATAAPLSHPASPSGSPEHKVQLGPKDSGGKSPAPPPQHVEVPHKPSPSGSPSDKVNLSPKGPPQQQDDQSPRKPSPSGSPSDKVNLTPKSPPQKQQQQDTKPPPLPPRKPSPSGSPSDPVALHPTPPRPDQHPPAPPSPNGQPGPLPPQAHP